MSYAVIRTGGKQYVVHEGERLLVDRLPHDEGAVFEPGVLLVDTGSANLKPGAGAVSARVLEHTLGKKIRIGKYKPKKGYRRHTGFRAKLTQIQIEAIGAGKATAPAKTATPAEPPVAAPAKLAEPAAPAAPKAAAEVAVTAEAKAPAKPAAPKAAPKAAAPKAPAKPAAKKPAAKKPAATKAPAKAKVEEAKKPAPKRAAPPKKTEE
jgi:large subunit ribosomal protein L21